MNSRDLRRKQKRRREEMLRLQAIASTKRDIESAEHDAAAEAILIQRECEPKAPLLPNAQIYGHPRLPEDL